MRMTTDCVRSPLGIIVAISEFILLSLVLFTHFVGMFGICLACLFNVNKVPGKFAKIGLQKPH